MNDNPKNQLQEFLANLGWTEDQCKFKSEQISPFGWHCSTVTVTLNDRTVEASGQGSRRLNAESNAARAILEKLHNEHPDLVVNWDEINEHAQAGDALIKLAVYISEDLDSASNKSKKLQSLESDTHLAKIFDQWKSQDHPVLAMWGNHLSEKRKATLVEALIWRHFRNKVIASNAASHLKSLLKTLAQDGIQN